MKRPPLGELIRNNVFFDTCVYHQPGIDLLLKIVPVDNILFGSEMVGAVRSIDRRPATTSTIPSGTSTPSAVDRRGPAEAVRDQRAARVSPDQPKNRER